VIKFFNWCELNDGNLFSVFLILVIKTVFFEVFLHVYVSILHLPLSDLTLCILWILLTIAGVAFQLYREQDRPPFPACPWSQFRFRRSAATNDSDSSAQNGSETDPLMGSSRRTARNNRQRETPRHSTTGAPTAPRWSLVRACGTLMLERANQCHRHRPTPVSQRNSIVVRDLWRSNLLVYSFSIFCVTESRMRWHCVCYFLNISCSRQNPGNSFAYFFTQKNCRIAAVRVASIVFTNSLEMLICLFPDDLFQAVVGQCIILV